MSNIGCKLVLLVKPLLSESRKVKPLKPKSAVAAIRAHAHWHLRARFCKGTSSGRVQMSKMDGVADKLLCVMPVRSPEDIPDILDKNRNASICVLVALGDSASINLQSVAGKVHCADPTANIEQFQIVFPPSKSTRELRKALDEFRTGRAAWPKAQGIYHLASRICTAFVQYHPPWEKNVAFTPIYPVASSRKQAHPKKAEYVRKIMDIRDAVDLVCGCLDGAMHYFPPVAEQLEPIFQGKDTKSRSVWARYKFPFGVWFRGSPRICLGLEPSLFRSGKPNLIHDNCDKRDGEQQVMFDECSLVHHFREYLPESKERYGAMFDWLCLMQHHNAPTRLLDWTENILYALYFAVRERDVDCDGVVWALNAGRLNEITRVSSARRYVCFPNGADVQLRTVMAISHNWRELRRNLIKLGLLEQVLDALNVRARNEMRRLVSGEVKVKKSAENEPRRLPLSLCEKLLYPVAVFPSRSNNRLAAQLGTFTLHGGKAYDPKLKKQFLPNRFGSPGSLVRLNALAVASKSATAKPFLEAWVVPSGSKRKIREQLKRLGVHAAAIFPELDSQSEYMKREWMIPVGESCEDVGTSSGY